MIVLFSVVTASFDDGFLCPEWDDNLSVKSG